MPASPQIDMRLREMYGKGMISRREVMGAALWPLAGAVRAAEVGSVPFLFGTYGMRSLSTAEALKAVSRIGYDGVELCLMPGWSTDPAAMSTSDRRELVQMLRDLRLSVPVIQESLPMVGTPEKRSYNLDRLKRCADLAHAIGGANPPLLDTVLGLKTSAWEEVKGRMAHELREWARVAEGARMTIAIKPHAAQAVHNAERALWLLKEVGSPRIRLVYDHSHFFIEGYGLEESLRQLFPYVAFIAMKDSAGTPEKHQYLLPGDGKTDYLQYFRLLKNLGYRGAVSVEVSSMIHRQPGYDPIATAQLCYNRLAPFFAKAGLRRPEPASPVRLK